MLISVQLDPLIHRHRPNHQSRLTVFSERRTVTVFLFTHASSNQLHGRAPQPVDDHVPVLGYAVELPVVQALQEHHDDLLRRERHVAAREAVVPVEDIDFP